MKSTGAQPIRPLGGVNEHLTDANGEWYWHSRSMCAAHIDGDITKTMAANSGREGERERHIVDEPIIIFSVSHWERSQRRNWLRIDPKYGWH